MDFNREQYKYVQCGNYKIAYQRSGSGIPVLMIHGITTYSFIWRKVVPEISNEYDLIRVDLLGCGASEMSPDFDLSLKNHAQLMIDFLDALEIEKAHLVGHDLGGGIVQIMAVNNPNRIISVSMLNPVGYDYWPVQPITSMRTPVFRQFAMAAFDLGYYRTIIRKALAREESYTKEILGLFWSNFETQLSKKSFMRFAKCLNNKDLLEISDKLKEIKFPVLIMRGDSDVFLSSGITTRLNEDIPGSKLQIVERAGHYIQEDAPTEIASGLEEFWGSSE